MGRQGLLEAGCWFRKKRLGQHFLADQKIIHEIVEHAGFRKTDVVLEIGPGKGALTLPLARSVGHIVGVEKDGQMVAMLRDKLSRAGITNVTLINMDILKWDFHEIKVPDSTRLQVIGNLPYNISSPFLEKLTENRDLVEKAVLMFQSEVAQRLTASPGGKVYGAITLLIQYYAHARILLKAPKEAFFPRPKVDSMVIELDFQRPYPKRAADEERFRALVRGAFAYRRKTLLNSLDRSRPHLDRRALLEGMEQCGIDPQRRAETLDMDEFLRLASVLYVDKI